VAKPIVLGRIVGEVQSWFGYAPVGTMVGGLVIAGTSREVQKSRNRKTICQHTCKTNSPQTCHYKHKTDSAMIRGFSDVVGEYGLQVLTKEQLIEVRKLIHSYLIGDAVSIAFSSEHLLVKGGNLDYYAGLEYVQPIESTREWKLYEAEDQAKTLINKCRKVCGLKPIANED
jgi:hypothetical protein